MNPLCSFSFVKFAICNPSADKQFNVRSRQVFVIVARISLHEFPARSRGNHVCARKILRRNWYFWKLRAGYGIGNYHCCGHVHAYRQQLLSVPDMTASPRLQTGTDTRKSQSADAELHAISCDREAFYLCSLENISETSVFVHYSIPPVGKPTDGSYRRLGDVEFFASINFAQINSRFERRVPPSR